MARRAGGTRTSDCLVNNVKQMNNEFLVVKKDETARERLL